MCSWYVLWVWVSPTAIVVNIEECAAEDLIFLGLIAFIVACVINLNCIHFPVDNVIGNKLCVNGCREITKN